MTKKLETNPLKDEIKKLTKSLKGKFNATKLKLGVISQMGLFNALKELEKEKYLIHIGGVMWTRINGLHNK